MSSLPPTLNKIIESFTRFPGIGKKTAHRLGLHVLKSNKHDIENFAQALLDVKNKISTCPICHNFSELDICEICSNNKRDNNARKELIVIIMMTGFFCDHMLHKLEPKKFWVLIFSTAD